MSGILAKRPKDSTMFPAGDAPLRSSPPARSMQDEYFADLRGKQLIDGASHWVQEERPEEVVVAP